MNAGIQGLAADIFKVALVRLDAALADGGVAEPADPAGARRGAPRGAAGRAGRGRRAHRSTPCAGAADLRVPARGQPLVRRELGRRQGLSAPGVFFADRCRDRRQGSRKERVTFPDIDPTRSEHHWFEPLADHLGAAYLRYSFTKGTEQEVELPGRGARAGSRACGCSTSAAARAPRARAGPARDRGRRRRHLAAVRRPGHGADAPAGRDVRAARRPAPCRSTTSSTPRSRCARAPSGWPAAAGSGATGHRSRRRSSTAWRGRCGPAGGWRSSAFPRTSRSGGWTRHDRSTPTRGREPRAHARSSTRPARTPQADLWTTCFTPRELRLLAPRGRPRVDHIWSVDPGEYGGRPRTSITRSFSCWRTDAPTVEAGRRRW